MNSRPTAQLQTRESSLKPIFQYFTDKMYDESNTVDIRQLYFFKNGTYQHENKSNLHLVDYVYPTRYKAGPTFRIAKP